LLIVLGVFYVIYKRIPVLKYSETKPFLLFLFICGVSLFLSSDFVTSLGDLLRLLSVFSVYVLTRYMASTHQKIRVFMSVVLLSALLPVIVGFAQWLSGTYPRLIGTFYHPNAFASYLLVILVFCSSQLLEKKSYVPRWLVTLIILPVGLTFLLTLSIGAWITFLCTMILMGLLRYKKLLVAIPLLAVIAVLTVPAVRDRLMDAFDPAYKRGRSSWEWRLETWDQIMTEVAKNPLIGRGLSMVSLETGVLAHNDYLRILAELGILGLSAYLLLAAVLLRNTWQDLRGSPSELSKGIQVGLLAIIVGFLVRETADNTLRSTVTMIYFWTFIALARNTALLDKTHEQTA